MIRKSLRNQRHQNGECNKHGWVKQNVYGRAKLRLNDAISLNFNPDNLEHYSIQRKPFVVKCDALDPNGTPIEIRRSDIVDDDGKKLSIMLSQYLSIKSYRDVYKLICVKSKISYNHKPINKTNGLPSKRLKITFDELYKTYPEIVPLDTLKTYGKKAKKTYYKQLIKFCVTNGVTEMFNKFISSDAVMNHFSNWSQNFKRKNFLLDCQSGIYHSSDLNFYVKPVRGYWGFDRMTVYVRLKKNV